MGTLTAGPRITHQFAPLAVNQKISTPVEKKLSTEQQQAEQLQELNALVTEIAALSAEIEALEQQAGPGEWLDYASGNPVANVRIDPAEWEPYEAEAGQQQAKTFRVNQDGDWEPYE